MILYIYIYIYIYVCISYYVCPRQHSDVYVVFEIFPICCVLNDISREQVTGSIIFCNFGNISTAIGYTCNKWYQNQLVIGEVKCCLETMVMYLKFECIVSSLFKQYLKQHSTRPPCG